MVKYGSLYGTLCVRQLGKAPAVHSQMLMHDMCCNYVQDMFKDVELSIN